MAKPYEFIDPNQIAMFSLTLGAGELFAPGAMAALAGAPDANPWLVRGLGLREIASGVALLTEPSAPKWMWARVAGDAMDMAVLFAAMRDETNDRGRLMAAMAFVAGVTVLDVLCAQRLTMGEMNRKQAEERAEQSIDRGTIEQDTVEMSISVSMDGR